MIQSAYNQFNRAVDDSGLTLIEIGRKLGMDSRIVSKIKRNESVPKKYISRIIEFINCNMSLNSVVNGQFKDIPVRPYPLGVRKVITQKSRTSSYYNSGRRTGGNKKITKSSNSKPKIKLVNMTLTISGTSEEIAWAIDKLTN